MKRLAPFLAVPLLSACAHQAQGPKEPGVPPLATVAAFVTPGLDMEQVEKKLSGHRPLQSYTYDRRSIWEYSERNTNPRTNSIQVHRYLVQFNPENKVEKSTLSDPCMLPDQEPTAHTSPSTLCYRRLELPFDEKIVYDALKRLLLNSNFQVEHSDAASRIIAANGMQPTKDKDEVLYMKVTINFTSRLPDVTELVMSANFNIVEKQMVWVQGGFAGVNIPIPLPFQKTEEWADTGLATPKFYLEFYDALENLIAGEYLRYAKPIRIKVGDKPVLAQPAPVAHSTDRAGNAATTPGGERWLPELDGPIDGDRKPRPPRANPVDAIPADADRIPELDGPIDGDRKPHSPKKKPVDAIPADEGAIPELDGPIDGDRKPRPMKKPPLVAVPADEGAIPELDGPIDGDRRPLKKTSTVRDENPVSMDAGDGTLQAVEDIGPIDRDESPSAKPSRKGKAKSSHRH